MNKELLEEIVPVRNPRKERFKKDLLRKQANTARWAKRYYKLKYSFPKRLERELDKLNVRWEKRVAKEKDLRKQMEKRLYLEKFNLNSRVKKLTNINAKLRQKAQRYDRVERFYTEPLDKWQSRLFSNEVLLRYLFTVEEMINTGELDRYEYWLLMASFQAEYITRIDLVKRFGDRPAYKLMNASKSLAIRGLIVKLNHKPTRIAITDLGKRELTSIIYKAKNRSMVSFK